MKTKLVLIVSLLVSFNADAQFYEIEGRCIPEINIRNYEAAMNSLRGDNSRVDIRSLKKCNPNTFKSKDVIDLSRFIGIPSSKLKQPYLHPEK